MKRALLLIGFLTFVSFVAAGQGPVPIEKEPMHRLRLENEHVRVFDVLVPAGKATLFHTHVLDGVGVRVSDAEMTDEITGGTARGFTARSGEAGFGSGPEFSHRVTNIGKTEFRNIYVELLPRRGDAKTSEIPPLSDGHAIVIDNPRVRVNRLVLKPGEGSKPHTHTLNGLGIIVRDARVEITSPGSDPRVMELKAGEFVWQKAGTAHSIRNIGTTVFEAVDIEIR